MCLEQVDGSAVVRLLVAGEFGQPRRQQRQVLRGQSGGRTGRGRRAPAPGAQHRTPRRRPAAADDARRIAAHHLLLLRRRRLRQASCVFPCPDQSEGCAWESVLRQRIRNFFLLLTRSGSVWSSPAAKEDDVLKKFDDVTSHMQEGKSLKRK